MIRDPSDGSVKEPQKPAPALQASQNIAERMPNSDAALAGAGPVINTATSGLQTGSGKPENMARLQHSREWLKEYHAKKNAKPE
jgi:hypothetical protein